MAVDNLVGQTLGQYELRELLGAGGWGRSTRATRPTSSGTWRKNPGRTPGQPGGRAGTLQPRGADLRRPRASQHHPHPRLGTQRGVSYLVLKLLTGGSLSERLEQHQDKLPSLGEIAALLKALSSAWTTRTARAGPPRHQAQQRHVRQSCTPYLVDFGIAKLVAGIPVSGRAVFWF